MPLTEQMRKRILRDFTYHKPRPDQQASFAIIRDTAALFATQIGELTPEGREQSIAITKLEEAVMWANAAVARDGQ